MVERHNPRHCPWRQIYGGIPVFLVLILLFVSSSNWGQAALENNLSNLREEQTLLPAAATVYAVDGSKVDSDQIDSAIRALGSHRAALWLRNLIQKYSTAGDYSRASEVLDLLQSNSLEETLSSVERRQLAGIRCAIVLSGLPTAEAGLYQLNQALELVLDYPDALALKGIALGQLGQQSEGLVLMRKSIELATKQEAPLIKLRLAEFYQTVGDINEAEATILELLNGHPDDSDALAFLSVLLVQENRCLEAIPYAQDALNANNRRGDLWRTLGDAYWCAGQKVLAIDAYQQAVNIEPAFGEKLKDRLTP